MNARCRMAFLLLTLMPSGPSLADGEECVHEYEAVVTEPTCTELGYTTYTCSKCGNVYFDNFVDALGHDTYNR